MGCPEGDLSDLLAEAALRRLVTAYSRAVDRRDFALLHSLYAPEAFDDHGAMYQGGVEGYIAFLRQALSRYGATTHYVVQTAFVITGDRAEGEVHKINHHREAGDSPHEVITGSRSLDLYVRRQGAWFFLRRSTTLDWAQRRPVDAAAYGDFAAASPPGQAGAGDPSYGLLAAFRRMEPDAASPTLPADAG